MWRRSESDCVHSQRRFQAPSREICTCMAPTLVQAGHASSVLLPPAQVATLGSPRPPAPAGRPLMEKFVIEGGVPLSGTITPAGNKNGALPILAACLLTDDEVILRNVPRIRDVEAMAALIAGLGARVEWLGPGEVLIDSSSVEHTQVGRG